MNAPIAELLRPAPAARCVTLHEAAGLLGVHYMTAYRYVRLGLLPAAKVKSSWQVATADIAAFRLDGGGAMGKGRSNPAPWSVRLGNRLRAGDEIGSWGVVEGALASGADPKDLYLDVVAPALRSIGDAWAAGEIDVAVEHRASVITMRLLGRLGPRFTRRGQPRGTVVLGAPGGDQHGLPVALLADLVRGAGFNVADLGSDTPPSSFLRASLEANRLVAVVVSVTTAGNGRSVRMTVAGLHEVVPGVPVLVGGGAVPDRVVATSLGADGWAPDARGALGLLEVAAAG